MREPHLEAAGGEPATARLDAFGALDGTELAGLAHMAGAERTLQSGAVLWQEGKRLPSLYLLLDGWMVSTLPSLQVRGVTAKAHLPGDLLGLPSLAYATASESVVALTPVKLRPLTLHSFGHLFEAHPRVAAMMFLVSQEERVALMDRLAMGPANASRRVAAFFCLLLGRMRRSFPDTIDSFFMPLKRQHVADLIGLSLSQLAAALKLLRTDDVLGWSGRVVTIVDEDALARIANLPPRRLVRDPYWFPAIEDEE